MRHPHGFIKQVLLRRTAVVVLCCSIIFIAVQTVRAQSGRRVSRRPPVSVAPPEAKPTATPPVVKSDQAQLSLYVSMSQRDPFINISRYLYDSLRNVFIQRLREASAINVKAGEELHRSEAIKRAKAEQSTHVVLLELEVDTFDQRGSSGNIDESSLSMRYTVFAPLTGKVKLEGRVYQQQYRAGRGGISLPSRRRNSPLYSDYLLKEAAREAANRVLESFSLYRPRETKNEVVETKDESAATQLE